MLSVVQLEFSSSTTAIRKSPLVVAEGRVGVTEVPDPVTTVPFSTNDGLADAVVGCTKTVATMSAGMATSQRGRARLKCVLRRGRRQRPGASLHDCCRRWHAASFAFPSLRGDGTGAHEARVHRRTFAA